MLQRYSGRRRAEMSNPICARVGRRGGLRPDGGYDGGDGAQPDRESSHGGTLGAVAEASGGQRDPDRVDAPAGIGGWGFVRRTWLSY